METCFVYLRKSTKRKDKQEYSIDVQSEWVLETLLKYPFIKVLSVDTWLPCENPADGFVFEYESAKQWGKERPEFKRLLEALRKYGCDHFIVWQPSRISRNSDDKNAFLNLLQYSVKYVRKSVITETRTYDTDNATHVMDLERELLAAKADNVARSGIAKNMERFQKRKGIFPHRFPFGYDPVRKDAHVSIDPHRAHYVHMAFELRKKWASWKEISDEFVRAGFPTINGDRARKMLTNPIYYGEFFYEWELVPIRNGGYKPIVSRPLFEEVQKYNEEHPRKRWNPNPLSGWKGSSKLLYGMAFDAKWARLQRYLNRKANKYYFRQPTKNFSYLINISEQKLFEAAERYVEQFRFPEGIIIMMREQLKLKLATAQTEADSVIHDLEAKITLETKKKNGYMDEISLARNERMKEEFRMKMEVCLDELDRLAQELEQAKKSNIDTVSMAEKYSKYFEDLPKLYKNAPISERSDILRWLGVRFVVWPDSNISVEWGDFEQLLKSLGQNDWK